MQLLTSDEWARRQTRTTASTPHYYIGLDLGQSRDFTALSVVEAVRPASGRPRLDCLHLERWPLDTSYTAMAADVVRLTQRPQLQPDWTLIVDGTGVGRGIVDLFRDTLGPDAARLRPVAITAGLDVTHHHGWLGAPKRELVSALLAALESGRLRFAEDLAELETLRAEAANFEMKVTAAANDVYGSWRNGSHDDLLLSLALAVWFAERGKHGQRRVLRSFQM